MDQSDPLVSDVYTSYQSHIHYDAKMIWTILLLSASVFLIVARATHTSDNGNTTGGQSLRPEMAPQLIVTSDHPFQNDVDWASFDLASGIDIVRGLTSACILKAV
ncbi:hypothetical protein BGX20_005407 [Mortierella sp. AD010]|nr:hypothetical protein BGX20_005407 [Mortierella sp. AD010]